MTLLLASILTFVSPSFAGQAPEPQVAVVAAPTTGEGVDLKVTMELQDALFGYTKIAAPTVHVAEEGDTQIIVSLKGEPYGATFTIRGRSLDALVPGQPAWAVGVVRQDSVTGDQLGKPHWMRFLIRPGKPVKFELDGWYELQMRNIRFTFSY